MTIKGCNIIMLSAFAHVTLYSGGAFAAAEKHAEDLGHAVMEGAHDALAHDPQLGAAHAEIEGLPQLDFTTYTPQLFWMVMIFALLYIVFSKKTLPDISGVIENRKNHIQSNLSTAEKLTAEADQVHDAYNENLQVAQSAAHETVQQAEGEMKAAASAALDDFRQRSETELQATEAKVLKAKEAAMGDMNAIVADTASVAVEKIIGKTDAGKVKAIVENMNGKAKAA